MGDNTTIEWARHPETGRGATWNPVVGCSLASPGCTNCYATPEAARQSRIAAAAGRTSHYDGTTTAAKAGPVWTGKLALAPDRILTAPLRWRTPRGIFVNSMGDLFHDDAPDAWIDRVFAVMALSPQHVFFVLTKRAGRMLDYVADPAWYARVAFAIGGIAAERKASGDTRALQDGARASEWLTRLQEGRAALPNVSLGVSLEDQRRADGRRRPLRDIAAAGWTTFVSYEPALGPVDFAGFEFLDCLISGGESGPNARPSHPDWHRAARDFAAAKDLGYHFKQWGEWAPELVAATRKGATAALYIERDGSTRPAARGARGEAVTIQRNGKRLTGRLLDGRTHDAIPTALPARSRPAARGGAHSPVAPSLATSMGGS